MNEGLVKFPEFQEDHKVTDVFFFYMDVRFGMPLKNVEFRKLALGLKNKQTLKMTIMYK